MDVKPFETKDVITVAMAAAGLALSVFNSVQATVRNRVRLKILSQSAGHVAANVLRRSLNRYPPGAKFCIEVVNLSAFPVTIDEIGFTRRGTKERSACPYPVLPDNSGWPRRLEAHESVSAYIDISNIKADIEKAYAVTQSGITRYGKSDALKQLQEVLKRNPDEHP